MRRRDLLAVLAGTVAACASAPSAPAAPKVYRIGLLSVRDGNAPDHHALWSTLRELGYAEGQNLMVERRFAAGDLSRLPMLAAELVRVPVDLIVTETTPAVIAARDATSSIPIVMAVSGDAVGAGLVASLAYPGGNLTGLTFVATDLANKRVELLKELVPRAVELAFIGNAEIPTDRMAYEQMKVAAASQGMNVRMLHAWSENDLENAFAEIARMRLDAASVGAIYTEKARFIAGLALRHKIPAGYLRREFVDAGGLASYGPSFADLFRRTAFYVDKIFKGAMPADLPVQQPIKFELVINLTAARKLGITFPRSLLARADEVIE